MVKKRIILIVTTVIVIIAGAIAGIGIFMLGELSENDELIINDVAASSLPDGTYSGEYGNGRWHNRIDVTIDEGLIGTIDVKDTVTFERAEVTQELIQSVISSQSTNVECISGATATCKVYLKSIENALQQSERK